MHMHVRPPPPGTAAAYLPHIAVQLTAGLNLEVHLDAGDGKGKGLFATKVGGASFEEEARLLLSPPLHERHVCTATHPPLH
jgi:hypothetical protein